MSEEVYDYLAQLLGYVFTALALLIAGNALILTLRDNRRAKELRRQGMEVIGRLVTLNTPKTEVYELTRSCLLGTSSGADVRILHHKGIKKRHLMMEYDDDLGAFVLTGIGNASFEAPSYDDKAILDGELNNTFSINGLTFCLELYGSGTEHYAVSSAEDEEYDTLFN